MTSAHGSEMVRAETDLLEDPARLPGRPHRRRTSDGRRAVPRCPKPRQRCHCGVVQRSDQQNRDDNVEIIRIRGYHHHHSGPYISSPLYVFSYSSTTQRSSEPRRQRRNQQHRDENAKITRIREHYHQGRDHQNQRTTSSSSFMTIYFTIHVRVFIFIKSVDIIRIETTK